MKIINEGIPTKLKFGKNRDLNFITITSNNSTCDENIETAKTILIRNGEISGSECVRPLLVLSTYQWTNIPKMISYPGEHFILLKKQKIKELSNFRNYIFDQIQSQ